MTDHEVDQISPKLAACGRYILFSRVELLSAMVVTKIVLRTSRLLSAALSVSLAPCLAQAELDESYHPFYTGTEDQTVLYLDGEIDDRSALNFMRALDQAGDPTAIYLSSPGGSVYSALLIAREINRRGMETIIPSGSICFSACPFLYFAGTSRTALGELGVHQISSSDPDLVSGQIALSDIVDALTDYGVPSDILVVMLRTPASGMYVFTPDEISFYGLLGPRSATEERRSGPPEPLPVREVPHDASRGLEATALAFVNEFNEAWSQANPVALSRIRSMYAASIDFYGGDASLDEVMAEKIEFAQRWPVRSYYLDLDGSTVDCETASRCVVEGEVAWDARSPERGAHSAGRSNVIVEMALEDGEFHIVREDGSVLERY